MLDKDNMPAHVAFIMDGNGRWASKKFLPRQAGHAAGIKALKKIVEKSDDLGIKHITVYAFSTENWKRSEEEVNGIFKLLIIFIKKETENLYNKNVKVNHIGEMDGLPKEAADTLKAAIERTATNTGLNFNLAINYGGRGEIKKSVQKIGQMIKEGNLQPENIDEGLIDKNLFTGQLGIPDPDLVIRTSGEERISNYLLWQIAYSEFIFVDTLWPDFSPKEFEKTIKKYQDRNRRFGGRGETK